MKTVFFAILTLLAGLSAGVAAQEADELAARPVHVGAERMETYLPLLEEKRVALVVNQTSLVPMEGGEWYMPLADTLLKLGVNVRCIMSPEHGYLGTSGAGKAIPNSKDPRTGISILSLYGETHKPLPQWMSKVDVVIFDLQDVGTRFYTYLSTLYYMLQSCAEEQTDIIVLDRPNPNDTIDGPMLRPEFRSFVGMVPVPLLHGCTYGELAEMIVGERWIGDSLAAPNLTVIPCSGWRHGQPYDLPVAPSPNLSTMQAIHLYPSLCLFEGTNTSVGRGTDFPFACYGNPYLPDAFTFTPRSSMYKGRECRGVDLRHVTPPRGFSLQYLLDVEHKSGANWITQPSFFDKLVGSDQLRQQIMGGMTEKKIRQSWQADLQAYRRLRTKYVLYDE